MAMAAVSIRRARLEDANGIATMLQASLLSGLTQPYYKADQIQAWRELLPSSSGMRDMLQENDRVAWVAVPTTTTTATSATPTTTNQSSERDASATSQTDKTITIAGYIDWKACQKELDLLYIHPLFSRQGIATRLFQKVLQEAATQKEEEESASTSNTTRLLMQTFASEGAKIFFETQNFQVVERRDFAIGDSDQIMIHNYHMELYDNRGGGGEEEGRWFGRS